LTPLLSLTNFSWLFVKCWGGGGKEKEKKLSGEKKEDAFFEVEEVAVAIGNAFHNLNGVVTTFGKCIGIFVLKRI